MIMDATTVAVAKDVVLAGAAIVASYVGVRGLGTWQRQLRGNTEYQLAKSMLVSVYEVREAIASVRHPFMQYSREPDLPQERLKDLSQREREWHALSQAYQRRWDLIPAAKAKLDANLLEAEVVWGSDIRSRVTPLNRLIGELLVAVQGHLEARNPDGHYESPGPELVMKRHEILYAMGEPDRFKEQVDEVIRGIESGLRPHIARHHR